LSRNMVIIWPYIRSCATKIGSVLGS
jgi:hypothetical protein